MTTRHHRETPSAGAGASPVMARRQQQHRRLRRWLPLLLLCGLAAPRAEAWSLTGDGGAALATDADQEEKAAPRVRYGVDVSFPIHHAVISDNFAWLPHNLDPSLPVPERYRGMPVSPLPGVAERYQDFIDGCVQKFGKRGNACLQTEQDRVEMSLRQPRSMVNYTSNGFLKIKCPPELWNLLDTFWKNNKDKATPERWGVGNTYTNNWASETVFVSVEDTKLRGGGYALKQKLWDAAYETISDWTGQELTPCSLYGIRVYGEGAILSTHVDRLPLVSSAIINVDQDLDEPWPLEVIGHDGYAYNVTMEPGDMVLYESHSVLHGRPFPLKGRYMANIFVHFEPTGHTLRHTGQTPDANVDQKYRKALEDGQAGHEQEESNGLPPYIIPNSPEESHWRGQHPDRTAKVKEDTFTTGSTPAHRHAALGRVKDLEDYIKQNKDAVNARDANGWTPLIESARGGHLAAVKLLVENGADINVKSYGSGATALWWAKQTHGEDHPVIEFLESLGALEAGPEL